MCVCACVCVCVCVFVCVYGSPVLVVAPALAVAISIKKIHVQSFCLEIVLAIRLFTTACGFCLVIVVAIRLFTTACVGLWFLSGNSSGDQVVYYCVCWCVVPES